MRNHVALLMLLMVASRFSFGADWQYSSTPVEGSDKSQVTKRANLVSENSVTRPSPPWNRMKEFHGELSVFETSRGTRVAFSMPGMDVPCDRSFSQYTRLCAFLIQFDDAPAVRVAGCFVNSNSQIRFDEPVRFLRMLQQSKRIRISMEARKAVTPTPDQARRGIINVSVPETLEINFEVDGLEYEAKGDGPVCEDDLVPKN